MPAPTVRVALQVALPDGIHVQSNNRAIRC